MERPYIICHMVTSVDGKVTGRFLRDPACENATEYYYQLHRNYKADAFACGRITMDNSFTDGKHPDLSKTEPAENYADSLPTEPHSFYAVAFDPRGKLGWSSGVLIDEDPGYDGAQVVEVLTKKADLRYLTYLKSMNIPYIFAGDQEFDIPLALEKLYRCFGIQKLLLEGGSVLGGSFHRAGCIDELSLVVAPLSADRADKPLFDSCSMTRYSLEDVLYQGGALWLNYRKV